MENTDPPEECGVGIRGVAMMIDAIVWFVLLFVALSVIGLITGETQTTANGIQTNLTGISAMVAMFLWLGLSISYHTLFEWRFGQTIGKYLVSIKTIADDGSPLTLRASLVRNVARLLDFLPVIYLLGIIFVVRSDQHKRVGDRLAATIVSR